MDWVTNIGDTIYTLVGIPNTMGTIMVYDWMDRPTFSVFIQMHSPCLSYSLFTDMIDGFTSLKEAKDLGERLFVRHFKRKLSITTSPGDYQ